MFDIRTILKLISRLINSIKYEKFYSKATLILLLLFTSVLFTASCRKSNTADSVNRKDDSPNVILITIDTLRADRLNSFGNQRIFTPTIDNLEREGTTFTNTYSQAPTTFPSHTSILTSTYPHTHGVRSNGVYNINHDRVTFLSTIFKNSGYTTAAIVSMDDLIVNTTNYKGFDFYDDVRGKQASVRAERGSEETNKVALKWLSENYNKIFFLWLHYFDPHTPYEPKEPFNKLYEPWDPTKRGDYNIPLERILSLYIINNSSNPDYYLSQYDGEITHNDRSIGEVVRFLKEKDIFDNTLIVVTSDHGDSFGEHDKIYFDHMWLLYDPFIHIPLIFKYPKDFQANKRIIDTPIESIDIAPTILDICKIGIPQKFEGKSLVSLIKGDERMPKDHLFYENAIPKAIVKDKIFGISDGTWQLIYAPNFEKYSFQMVSRELYNLIDDPSQMNNLVGSNKEVENKLWIALKNWLDKDLDFVKKEMPMIKTMQKPLKIFNDTEEKLKSLGYIGSDRFVKLAAPKINYPENGVLSSNPPEFDWEDIKIAQSYTVTIVDYTRREIVEKVKNDIEMTNKMKNIWKDLPAGSFKWFVQAVDKNNKNGEKSNTFIFTKLSGNITHIMDSKHLECEDSLHNTGKVFDDPSAKNKKSITCKEGLDKSQYMVFGQNVKLNSGMHKAIFSIKTEDLPKEDEMNYIDVSSKYGKKVFASMTLKGIDFDTKDIYKQFSLEFLSNKEDVFEFRIWYCGKGSISADYIDIYPVKK